MLVHGYTFSLFVDWIDAIDFFVEASLCRLDKKRKSLVKVNLVDKVIATLPLAQLYGKDKGAGNLLWVDGRGFLICYLSGRRTWGLSGESFAPFWWPDSDGHKTRLPRIKTMCAMRQMSRIPQ